MSKAIVRTHIPERVERAPEPPAVASTMTDGGCLRVEMSGNWSAFVKAAGSTELANLLVPQVAMLGENGKGLSDEASNTVLGFVSAMKPRDPAELLLLTQMAAIHRSTMMLAQRLNHTTTIPQQDAAERALNKLARTFAGQMETLKRYRSKGQQTVRVERVTVESGGQAIVGHVEAGGGGGHDES